MFGSGDGIGLLKRFHGGLEIFKTDSHWKWPLNEAFGSKRLSADPVSLRAWCFVGSSNVLRLEPHFGLDFHPITSFGQPSANSSMVLNSHV